MLRIIRLFLVVILHKNYNEISVKIVENFYQQILPKSLQNGFI